ncbi:calcium-binding protein [Saccharothrix variisporea]|uniref:Hemolysin type calcium-binding protein n=1 Tax=Saccharothrix variisporea TaxID=543527 RepID=A0A495XQC8_9PSEU|nr:calcium-binding protein [Saccharothrix variisporea]RKT74653.1 hemolysin type calcium-binding protein [Saccharothrix variisporea]
MRVWGIAVLAASLAVLPLVPGVASAGDAAVGALGVVDGVLSFTAYDGVDNQLKVETLDAGRVRVEDRAGALDLVGRGCVDSPARADEHQVICDLGGVTAVVLDGRDGDDSLDVRDPMSVHLLGGAGNDQLNSSAGDDVLDGGPGNDVLYGGLGDDVLTGGPGADLLDGAADVDVVSYAERVNGVVADLDGSPGDDGAPGEHDTILGSVEHLVGGAGDDTLVGSGAPNTLVGGPGDDRLSGLGGADVLVGGAGFDLLDGGPQVDTCDVGPGGGTTAACELLP